MPNIPDPETLKALDDRLRLNRLLDTFRRLSPLDQLKVCEMADQLAIKAQEQNLAGFDAAKKAEQRNRAKERDAYMDSLRADVEVCRRWARGMGRVARGSLR